MKNVMKKIIAVFAVLCVATTSLAACSSKEPEESNSGNSSSSAGTTMSDEDLEAVKKYPLSIGAADEENDLALDDPNADLEGDDPVESATTTATTTKKKADIAPVTEIQTVTAAGGAPVTEVVEVTDDAGVVQTDADNKPVTETAVVTEIISVTTTEEAEETTEENATEAATSSDYKSKNDGRYAMWLDVSKDENFMFEDAMLTAEFNVKEGIPDGDYRIRISPDLSDIAGVVVNPSKVIDGTIRVNNGEIEAVDVSSESGLVFYGDNIACKQGESIKFNINIKNNPGLAAFCIWFYFDGNAFEFVDAYATGEFEEIAKQTDIGSN